MNLFSILVEILVNGRYLSAQVQQCCMALGAKNDKQQEMKRGKNE